MRALTRDASISRKLKLNLGSNADDTSSAMAAPLVLVAGHVDNMQIQLRLREQVERS